jgi:hypothetical protein
MGFLVVIIVFALSGWSIIALFRRLRRVHAGLGLWSAFAALIVVGAAIGFWCSFHCEYHAREDFRVASFPIPIVFFRLEEGNWVDYPVPDYQVWPTAVTNILAITALATLPLWLLPWTKRDRKATAI